MNSRDDFSQKVKDILCERVGGKCSNPDCRHETKGPHSDSKKRVSIGQAAHITAASKGGPRYNPNMTSEQRRDIENGIWLCDSCAKMIDSDESQYPVELLKMWKSMAEYEQYCAINRKANLLERNCEFENRKKVACRKVKEAIDNLHNTLYYAYEYWKLNFADRFKSYDLENELDNHWELYRTNLEQIYAYEEKQEILHAIIAEYALDLGAELCNEINGYCNLLKFVYQSDTCGIYNNYWRCFFEMLSTCFEILVGIKKTVDDILYRQYSV